MALLPSKRYTALGATPFAPVWSSSERRARHGAAFYIFGPITHCGQRQPCAYKSGRHGLPVLHSPLFIHPPHFAEFLRPAEHTLHTSHSIPSFFMTEKSDRTREIAEGVIQCERQLNDWSECVRNACYHSESSDEDTANKAKDMSEPGSERTLLTRLDTVQCRIEHVEEVMGMFMAEKQAILDSVDGLRTMLLEETSHEQGRRERRIRGRPGSRSARSDEQEQT
ncbi:hypothetical protein BC939DRAFT_461110 [Gamsiella multidivaricata]|uniref:uncharacterized protein n=1 Tax=Gamsiella multidivaricata TaxID=101098 RepID=UPI00221E759C|nr:uncharacterized protein BC939DRAFT_461110 [Gamsiella multidivaricata]KAI7819075.1 hypothetical protein BC939DRAFT_461110 [Gamsiella multidivaricata]